MRPEDLVPTDADAHLLTGRIAIVEKLGADTYAHLDTPASPRPVIVRVDGNVRLSAGETMRLTADPRRTHLFSRTGERVSPDHPAATA